MATPCYISCDMFFVRIVQIHYYHNNFFVRMVADAPLSQHFFCQNGCRCDSESQSDKAEHTKRM